MIRILSAFVFLLACGLTQAATFTSHFTQAEKGKTKDGAVVCGEVAFHDGCISLGKGGKVEYADLKVNPDQGKISFDIRFDFDTKQVSANFQKNPLTCQNAMTIQRQDKLKLLLYFLFDSNPRLCVGVFDSANKVYQLGSHVHDFKPDTFYHVDVIYGEKLEILINGVPSSKVNTQQYLFGNVGPSPMKMYIGSGNNNCFSIKNVSITDGAIPEQISIPFTSAPMPDIDGELQEAFWENSVPVSGFVNAYSNGCYIVAEQPQLFMSANAQGVFLAGRIPAQSGAVPRASASKRDGQVYLDDAVEIRFQPKMGEKIRLFMINCAGQIYDSLETPGKFSADSTLYDPEWKHAAKVNGNVWQFEAFFPYDAIGFRPEAGQTVRGNICVDRAGVTGGGLSLFKTTRFNDEKTFGDFLFTGKNQAVGLESVGTGNAMQPKVVINKPGDRQPVVFTQARLYNSRGTKIDSFDFRFNDIDQTLYAAPDLPPGNYRLEITAYDEEKTRLLRRILNYNVDSKVVMEVSHYAYEEKAVASLRVAPGTVPGAVAACVTLRDKSGNVLQTKDGKLEERMSFDFSTKQFPAGEYTIDFALNDAQGKTLESTSRTLSLYPKPQWFNHNRYTDHTVPVPWTPVKGDSKQLSVWNRTIQYNGKVFPQQIVNGKENMFVSAPQLKIQLATGENIFINDLRITKEDSHDDEFTFQGSTVVSGYEVKLSFRLEFDGCMRGDLVIIPPSQGGEIKNLTMEFPLQSQWGKFLLTGDGGSMNAIPLSRNTQKTFVPYNWVGNEKGGLAIFFESEQYWTLSNKNAICIEQADKCVLWKYNIINAPLRFRKPVSLTFGMMPTPVRPPLSTNPFSYPKVQEGPGLYSYGETLMYPVPKGAKDSGAIDFIMRRDASREFEKTEFFQFGSLKNISPFQFFADNAHNVSLVYGNKTLAMGKLPCDLNDFHNMTLAWSQGTIRCLCDGKEVLQYKLNEKEAGILADMLDTGRLIIGGCGAWRINTSDLIVDEVRISNQVRQEGVPTAPWQMDNLTFLVDHLNDSFTPDGFSRLTSGGGEPSSGSRFVPGRFGKALALISEKPRTNDDFLTNVYKSEIDLIWQWHTDKIAPSGEYQWPPDYFHPLNERVKKAADAAHKNNRKFLAYCIYPAIHYPSRLADQFRKEWQIEPVNMMPYAPPEGHNMLSTSMAAKGWADYLIAGLEDAFRMYHFNGIYTDGGCNVLASTNGCYGSGWTDDRGNRRPTWPFFAARDNFKRIYKMVKKDNPDNLVVNHISFSLPMMTASFTDILYTGEHENYYDMNTVRLRFNSKPWGPTIFLVGASDHAFSALHFMSGLLVGTGTWRNSVTGRRDLGRKQLRVSQVYQQFDADHAKFIPFYEMEEKLGVKLPADCYACCYHKAGEMMLLVANYNKESRTVKVTIPNSCIAKAEAPLVDAPVPHDKESFTLVLLPENFQVVKISFE